jgi:hypothetical protein
MRAHGEYLGTISAADEKNALKLAIKFFEITEFEEQKRLLVRRA